MTEVCAVCGKVVTDFAGHYVDVIEQGQGDETVTRSEYHCFECDGVEYVQEVCALCGKVVNDFAGHYVDVYGESEGDGEAESRSEFHCFECDPVVIPEDVPEEEIYGGGNN